jgi:hypothetical protein
LLLKPKQGSGRRKASVKQRRGYINETPIPASALRLNGC